MFKINIFNKTILGFLTVLIVLLVYFLIVYQPDCNNENTIKKKTGIGKFCYNDDEVFTSISEIKAQKVRSCNNDKRILVDCIFK